MHGAPLYGDVLALAGVLLSELESPSGHPASADRLVEGALRLLDLVSLALAGFERIDRLLEADAELVTLRSQLDLAYRLEVLSEDAFVDLAGQVETIGRQIGGWLKRLQGARAAPG